jgi:hypothetical protein
MLERWLLLGFLLSGEEDIVDSGTIITVTKL